MKIIRAADVKPYERPHERMVRQLVQIDFPRAMTSMACFLGYAPRGHLDEHYHRDSIELIFFPMGGRIRVNGEHHEMNEWDVVILEAGDVHGYEPEAGQERAAVHFAIKLPSDPDRHTS